MLHDFILSNSEQIVDRARMRGRDRALGKLSEARLAYGIPLFLSQLADQLVPTLAEERLHGRTGRARLRRRLPDRNRPGARDESTDQQRGVPRILPMYRRSHCRSGRCIRASARTRWRTCWGGAPWRFGARAAEPAKFGDSFVRGHQEGKRGAGWLHGRRASLEPTAIFR
jgi:hypothetical protein